jgi:hypothetical protein
MTTGDEFPDQEHASRRGCSGAHFSRLMRLMTAAPPEAAE